MNLKIIPKIRAETPVASRIQEVLFLVDLTYSLGIAPDVNESP